MDLDIGAVEEVAFSEEVSFSEASDISSDPDHFDPFHCYLRLPGGWFKRLIRRKAGIWAGRWDAALKVSGTMDQAFMLVLAVCARMIFFLS